MDERKSNVVKANKIRQHKTRHENIREGCLVVFLRIANGDIGGAAEEMHTLLSIVENKAIRSNNLAYALGVVSLIAIAFAIFMQRKQKKNEQENEIKVRASRREAEDYVRTEIEKNKKLEVLRDIMKLGISSVTEESLPDIMKLLRRATFFADSESKKDRAKALKALENVMSGFDEMAELLTELEEEICPKAVASGHPPSIDANPAG